jgi:hypothetical protein
MPILGIIASQNYPRITNSYQSIATVTVGSGGQANIEFTSIPSTYKHLQIRLSAQGTAGYDVNLRLNSDTGSNYAFHYLNGQGASAGTGAGTSTAYINFSNNFLQGATIPAVGIMDILDYASTSKYKTTRALAGSDANGSGWLQLGSGLWQNTAAITTIQLYPASSQTFSQYTSAALYGIKG